MLKKSFQFVGRSWWGSVITLVLISAATYLLIWQVVEPLDIPGRFNSFPEVLRTRPFFHVALTLFISPYVTLVLDLIMKKRRWARFQLPHDETLPIGHEGLSLEDLRIGVITLAEDAKQFAPDFIYGINRGGAIIGGLIAKQLRMPEVYLLTVNCDLPLEFRVVEHRAHGNKPRGRVLLVDDVKRKGEHMREAAAFLRSNYQIAGLRRVVLLELKVPHQGPEKVTFRDDTVDRSVFFTNDSSVLLPWDPI